MQEIPFNIATAESKRDWRIGFRWPVALSSVQTVLLSQFRSYLQCIKLTRDPRHQAILLLAANHLLAATRPLLQAAQVVKAEREHGVSVVGGPPELDYLRERGSADVPFFRAALDISPTRLRGLALRRAARVWSWSGWRGLPASLLAPDAVAVSHNALLRDAARRTRYRLSFRHADSWLERIRARYPNVGPVKLVDELEEMVTKCLIPPEIEAVRSAGPVHALVRRRAQYYLSQAAGDLARLSKWRRLPRVLWSGTGGYYPARAFGLEVLRRGGSVRRFDHGGTSGMVARHEPVMLTELSVSTDFVTATESVARLVRQQGAEPSTVGSAPARVVGHVGDPTFKIVDRRACARGMPRPTILYVSTILLGFRQLYPPLLPDPVYLDWQLRLVEMLLKMPIRLVCKPHPEGLMAGRPHPLEAVAETTTQSFEAVMHEADGFVFDYPQSTTFWESLCTSKRVVFVDLGITGFNPSVAAEIHRRCRVVPVEYGTDHLPYVNVNLLANSVLEDWNEEDPSFFRRMLAGC